MKYLVTADEMRKYDRNTIERIGIPEMVLMERAALAAYKEIDSRFNTGKTTDRTVLVLAGTGNNGGDGLALARLLSDGGYRVEVRCVGNPDRATEQWKRQREILRNYSVSVGSKASSREYTILVDALFGVGLSRAVTGEYEEAVKEFNNSKGFKVSLDIPSGLHADTGEVTGCAVKADMTVTFGFCKRGLVFYPGCEYAGEVIIAPIGISKQSFFGELPDMFYYDEEPDRLLPKRERSGNKGTFGKVLLVAGSVNMAGAAVLAARAAYRTGAGLVKIISPSENRVILQGAMPEALFGTQEELKASLSWADVIVIGPGIGTDEYAENCLRTVIMESNLPLVIDADGLNLLSKEQELRRILTLAAGERPFILTPHVGELSRLTGESIDVLRKNLPFYGRRLAEYLKGVVVAKDARTFVCGKQMPVCVNIRGNSGMATAGSGDVLTGIIAGLLAQGMPVFEAACAGVYIHACAGDAAAQVLGEHALMAGNITENIGCTKRI